MELEKSTKSMDESVSVNGMAVSMDAITVKRCLEKCVDTLEACKQNLMQQQSLSKLPVPSQTNFSLKAAFRTAVNSDYDFRDFGAYL